MKSPVPVPVPVSTRTTTNQIKPIPVLAMSSMYKCHKTNAGKILLFHSCYCIPANSLAEEYLGFGLGLGQATYLVPRGLL